MKYLLGELLSKAIPWILPLILVGSFLVNHKDTGSAPKKKTTATAAKSKPSNVSGEQSVKPRAAKSKSASGSNEVIKSTGVEVPDLDSNILAVADKLGSSEKENDGLGE